ncbi:MAG: cytochrome d ubiquinol oxidase subunit II, partial [Pseudomonadota bacterium]
FGAFPTAYGLLLSALYLPAALLFLGFIMRGIGLEYYHYAGGSLKYRQAFAAGSLLTAAAQGLGVGVVLTGLPLDPKGFTGGVWEWINPLSIILAFSLPCWYALLGAAGIVERVRGKGREFGRKAARAAAYLSLATGIVLILWGLAWKPFWALDWLAWPGFMITLVPILLGVLVFAPLIKGLSKETKNHTFQFTVLAVCLIFAGLTLGLHPYLVWPNITISAAAATPATLKFMLIGIGVFFPFIVVYNAYIYSVFWRNTKDHEDDPS